MRRDQLNPHKTATYVMPRHKAVYVAVNKAACTSLKWLVADLQGEDPERFQRSVSREVTREMCIHRRSMFRHTPMLHRLPDDALAEIAPENGWFVFAVVRHPSARLFSAWQSKFLLREPRWVEMFGGEPWFPAIPRSTEQVAEGFERFVTAMAQDDGHLVMKDRHFMPQRQMVAPDTMPYSRIYDTSEIGTMLQDLERHLRAQGWAGKLRLRQTNETPLRPLASLFTPQVQEAIRSLHGDDFEAFGYADTVPPKLHDGDGYPDVVLDEIARIVERHERIGDLALRGQALSQAHRKAMDELEALKAQQAQARQAAPSDGRPASLRAVAGRARRRLAAVVAPN